MRRDRQNDKENAKKAHETYLQDLKERARELSENLRRQTIANLDMAAMKRAVAAREKVENMNQRVSLPLDYDQKDMHDTMLHLREMELAETLRKQIEAKRQSVGELRKALDLPTSLQFGDYQAARRQLMEKYNKELRTQVGENLARREGEVEAEKRGDALKRMEIERFSIEESAREKRAEIEKRMALCKSWKNMQEDNKKKKQEEDIEKRRWNDLEDKRVLYEKLIMEKEAAVRREHEKIMHDTLAKQMKLNEIKREEERTKKTNYTTSLQMMCSHHQKMYACATCNREYPRAQLTKKNPFK
jgi:hypothetical protein